MDGAFHIKILPLIAIFFIKLFGIFLLPWSLFIAYKEKRFSKYRYEVARGWDILANKMYEPVFNKKLVKKNGRKFGGDETISQCMAFNKYYGYDTPTAKKWERRINLFDKNHLDKINLN